ncbi:pyruvoyl-dependent arginine decarboxylase [Candidatus Woesearchaeota archaeon]|nr:pyruvoyl-dependent arginine decarboxylase [Candidatus Woesearchaeota archaeon]
MTQQGFKVKARNQYPKAAQQTIIANEASLQEALLSKSYNISIKRQKQLIVGCRIPRKFFWTSGIGESDITIHAGSYHLALKEAGIERYNIMVYSSIMPSIAEESTKPASDEIPHGSVMETIMAVSSGEKGKRLTAGIIYGWLYHKITGKRHGGLVCEYSGNETEENAQKGLRASLKELYTNGFSEEFDIKDIRMESRSFVPKKKFGTAMVVIGFKDYVYPIIQE